MTSAKEIATRITLKNCLKDEPDAIKNLFLGFSYYEPVEKAYVNQNGDRYIWNDGTPKFVKA